MLNIYQHAYNSQIDKIKKSIEEANDIYENMLDKTTKSLEKIIKNDWGIEGFPTRGWEIDDFPVIFDEFSAFQVIFRSRSTSRPGGSRRAPGTLRRPTVTEGHTRNGSTLGLHITLGPGLNRHPDFPKTLGKS